MMKVGDMYSRGVKTGRALLFKVGDAYMTGRTLIAFVLMAMAAHRAGVMLALNSGWRSFEHQAQLYADFKSGKRTAVAAPPGHSNHQSGIALDIETGGGRNAAFVWLTAHAHRFGFKRTVQSEPWHWEHRPTEVRA